MRIAAIVPAAGSGERLGASLPKALVAVAGHSLICRAVETVAQYVDLIVVAAPHGYEKPISVAVEKWSDQTSVITGGITRRESVSLALATLPDDVDYVLVHDAARCFTPGSVFLERSWPNTVSTGLPSSSTIMESSVASTLHSRACAALNVDKENP